MILSKRRSATKKLGAITTDGEYSNRHCSRGRRRIVIHIGAALRIIKSEDPAIRMNRSAINRSYISLSIVLHAFMLISSPEMESNFAVNVSASKLSSAGLRCIQYNIYL